jgi:aminoglycoside phosphotransferase (APT) family kinase protein
MMMSGGELYIIDFDRYDFGDPWEEFNRVWSAEAAPEFARGTIDGYFEGEEIPELFWRLILVYICRNMLSSLPWAIPFGEGEVEVMRKQADNILSWYDNMKTVIPNWYNKGK